ncbi:DNA (cytosine-5)-methyltransferase 1 [Rhizobium mesoamericanum]|uniref:DNA cytosine methyltransferase n=1 Tax=Rhizobium mesoamericanum TaxID=1079800 RepID=UPI0027850047|nr:DNA (cytosine-5-)-methyltransferase [Rhizobium mesoamericanum]MDQ0561502.1 DNA (cytosine-5)-methyltransferase 1 [Rhizobium mesoamericanum]
MAEIDIKAKALSDARERILKLQEQMTDRVLQMAAEVEKLMTLVSPAEARSFLKARCNLPSTELSTYVAFATALKRSEDVLRNARASFPVVKALVSADANTREDILARMAAGAQIDTKDVATIRRRLAAAKLTASEAMTAHNRKIVAAAARKQVKAAVLSFEEKTSFFIEALRSHLSKSRKGSAVVQAELRHQAPGLLNEFESLFGKDFPAKAAPNSAGHRMGLAHRVLGDIASGRIDGVGPIETTALQTLSGKSRVQIGGRAKVMSEIPSKAMRPRVLELCAGAGGLALGLERAAFEHVALVEYDRNAAATLRLNRPDWNVIEVDVRKMDFTRFRQHRVDIVAGGLPCTPFSTVGERKGKHDDNDLLMEGVRAVKEVAPKAFLFENVEGLLHAKHADYVAALLRKLSRLGYQTEIHRINSRDYGVAQDRPRVMIVGFRKDLAGGFRMPPKFPKMAKNMGDVLADLMGANGWSAVGDWVSMMRKRPEFDRFGKPIGIGALSDTIRGYQGSAQEGEARRALKNGVSYAPPAKAAPTNEEAAKEGFVPRLTNRMRARLQDFPDEWAFVGGIGSVADQIGNAVAPAVGQAMGLALTSALKGWEIDWEAIMRPQLSDTKRIHMDPPALGGPEPLERVSSYIET